jgi:DNA-binding IclR family transcriptional regulator
MKTIRAVERSTRVLFFLGGSASPVGLSEIARAVGVDKATTLRILTTFEQVGAVRQDEATRGYRLGPNISALVAAPRPDLRQITRPLMDRLWEATGETVCLVVPNGYERVHVEVLPGRHELRFDPVIGLTWPLYIGASGKAMLAFMPKTTLDEIIAATGLDPGRSRRAPTEAQLRRELAKIRRDGYAISSGETVEGGAVVAAPVFDRFGDVVASIAVRGPAIRLTTQALRALAPSVREAAAAASVALGWNSPAK